MKALVTGGCGDVGIALSEKLVESGHRVVVYDQKQTRLPNGVSFIQGDVRDFSRLVAAASQCDTGIHLAVSAGDTSAEDIMSVNVSGAYGFLLAASSANFRNSVIASSAPVHLPPSQLDDGILLSLSFDFIHN